MNSAIEFVLDGETRRIEFDGAGALSPTTTVLQYLRSLPAHKGTKEGCAEGDCGACTVVLADAAKDGSLRYSSIDSCLVFLPMIHGKQLITVENLKNAKGELHPVQQAMVDTHGSQCGYCTPGFVMSVFALSKNAPNATRAQIDDALTGNLCRCTGYRPIIAAAAQACANQHRDHFAEQESRSIELLRGASQQSLYLHTAEQTYFRPATLAEALALLREHPGAVVTNGATDVALRVTKRNERIGTILDLSAVNELRIAHDSPEALTLGAGISLEQVRTISERAFPALASVLTVFGSLQIRNLATLGGNLGSASPIGDTLPVLMAYQARVVLRSEQGERVVPLDGFVTGYRQTVRTPEELIVAVVLPKLQQGTLVKSYKVSKRKDLDISTVSAAYRLERGGDGSVRNITLVYGGMAERTKRASQSEEFLNGKSWTRTNVEEAMKILETEFTPISDARSGADFRRLVARNLLMRFWLDSNIRESLRDR